MSADRQTMPKIPSILFVCLGNICRSPLAEAALRQQAAAAGIDMLIDSAGTGSWHVGKGPDPRASAQAERHGVDIRSYRARQATPADFHRFDRILALDAANLADLARMAPPRPRARLSLLLDHVPGLEGQDVADPYFGEAEGFETTWQQVSDAARHLVETVRREAI